MGRRRGLLDSTPHYPKERILSSASIISPSVSDDRFSKLSQRRDLRWRNRPVCGLTGFIQAKGTLSGEDLPATAARMAETLRHRGPDDSAVWADTGEAIAIGFRRLAILDLSSRGRQPMHSADGRFVLAFNGEIYNHPSLRDMLETRPSIFRAVGH